MISIVQRKTKTGRECTDASLSPHRARKSIRRRSSGPVTVICATKTSSAVGGRQEEGKRRGNGKAEGKSGGIIHLELLAEERARLLVRALEEAKETDGLWK
jgi:hypothetical protein